ncbi:MAG TPA: ABC transporter permease [Ilumatobacteraceae bacterium]|nr:ABC transporter permease [Ilumatobacteraceae bacterium]
MNEWPSTVGLVVRQIRYQLLLFWRVPVALFFTLLLPLIMLVLFNALFGDGDVTIDGNTWPIRQFYTGGLAAFTAVSATYTNLANMLPIRREEGVLKRWRGTPLPPWIYLAGVIGAAVVIAAFGVLIMLGLGVVAYDLEVEAAKVPAAAVTFVVGVAAFAALGMAVAGLVPSASSASAVANATILPLAFVSNVFIPIEDPPAWLATIGDIFPLKPFASSFQDAFNPFVDAPAFDWGALAVIAAWGIAGLVAALTTFRWEPIPGGPTRRRGAPSAAVDAPQ